MAIVALTGVSLYASVANRPFLKTQKLPNEPNLKMQIPLLECVPKVFANGSNEVSYADTSGVSCWWG